MMRRHTAIFRIPLNSFAPHRRLISEDFLRDNGERQIEQAWRTLRGPGLAILTRQSAVPGYHIGSDGYDYRNGIVVIRHSQTGRVVGGIARGVVLVEPEHRGHYLGAETVILAFRRKIKRLDDPVVFSPAGLGNRRAAHRIEVQRALQRGVAVPQEVLADYPSLESAHVLRA
jgi:hypothetical protein